MVCLHAAQPCISSDQLPTMTGLLGKSHPGALHTQPCMLTGASSGLVSNNAYSSVSHKRMQALRVTSKVVHALMI